MDPHELYAAGLCPPVQCPPSELGALIGADGGRVATEAADRYEQVRGAPALYLAGARKLHRLIRAVLPDRQSPEMLTVKAKIIDQL